MMIWGLAVNPPALDTIAASLRICINYFQSWAAAAQETFLTWGLLGACVMQFTSYKNIKKKSRTVLQRESTCIVLLTFTILILAAFLANACIVVLKKQGYVYLPGSFENVKSSQFLWPINEPLPGSSGSIPVRYMGHYGSVVGITVWRGGGVANQLSGWQPLQLLTQMVPATLAVVTTEVISPAWSGMFYFILITLGIAQQLAIWHCVVAGIVSISKTLQPWETVITLLTCILGLLVGLIFTTDGGIRVVQFVDYVWVGAWWQCAAQVALACGVFAVRGRPYTGDVVVAALFGTRGPCTALSALLSFTWNVILPVTLCAICVIDFRMGDQRQLYTWRKPTGYYPIWARQIAVLLQQGALLTMPVAAFVQTWRYMSKGPPDILDRIQNLYRPRLGAANEGVIRGANSGVPGVPGVEVPATTAPVLPDPPPKYTPPPSYSTATGARLLHSLRRSFRTLRRMATSRPESSRTPETQVAVTLSESVDQLPLTQPQPPEYGGLCSAPVVLLADETRRPGARRSLSFTRDVLRRSFVRNGSTKSIRSSLRRSFRYGSALTTSHEQLVRSAEPMSSTAAVSDFDWSAGHSRASVI
ncbi:Sodium- and chloride-dependent glycine transporter 1 [Eumeta japonica]|uniref:Sodium-and chloride-dependent glycine transporter 1 n=1 Tax=Eumeta variegata TaxID=151549 RepID=A0A4C1Z0J1_EUMVA|nr:Sodium- and chloride-dependent glycine transporter 1 [Eumeta japonica]